MEPIHPSSNVSYTEKTDGFFVRLKRDPFALDPETRCEGKDFVSPLNAEVNREPL